MRGSWVRAGLGLSIFVLGVAGVVVATDATEFPGGPAPTVALMQTAATGCLAVGGYRAPDPGSVGLPAGLPLCASGPVSVTQPGTVLDGWDVRGGVVVTAPGTVIRRSRITGDGSMPYGVRVAGVGSVRIEDTTLTGDFPAAAIGDERWTGERIAITEVTHDGARLGDGARLRNSTVDGLAVASAADALVLHGVDALVEDNRIEAAPSAGSALRVAPTGGAGGAVTIRGNVLGGGRFTVFEDPSSTGRADVWITGNRFRRETAVVPLRVSPRAVLTDNTFVDGGLLPDR